MSREMALSAPAGGAGAAEQAPQQELEQSPPIREVKPFPLDDVEAGDLR